MSAVLSTVFLPTVAETEEPYTFAHSPTVKEYTEEYFSDIPVLADVAWCESRYRQFSPQGDIFRGEINKADVGVMQINEYYHLKDAQKLDFDLYSLEGNLAYARYLYEKQGLKPWVHSKKCWKGSEHLAGR